MRRFTVVLLTLLVALMSGLASLAILRSSIHQRRQLQDGQARRGLLAAAEILRGEAGEMVAAMKWLTPEQATGWARRHPRVQSLVSVRPGEPVRLLAGRQAEADADFVAWVAAASAGPTGSLRLEPSSGETLWVWAGAGEPGRGLAVHLNLWGAGELLREAGLDYTVGWVGGDATERSWSLSRPAGLDQPVKAEVNLEGLAWRIAVAPRSGWASAMNLKGAVFVSLLLPLLCGGIAYEVGRRSMTLRDEVGRWTERLSDANRELGSEIRKREDAEARLRHHAHHDPLTGLPNRASLAHRLRLLSSVPESERSFLICIDIGRFKAVNEAWGQLAGDAAIVQMAQRIVSALPSEDRLFRVGGAEFAVLSDRTPSEEAARESAQHIALALRDPFPVKGEPIHVSPTIGIALGRDAPRQTESLLDSAAAAVQSAKEDGGAAIRFFEPHMLERARARFETEIDLRKAIAGGELRPHLQPIVEIETGRVAGFEALVRWEHPNQGLIPPGRFLPLAEDAGLMAAISLSVFQQVCELIQDWRGISDAGDFYVSFNLCAADLRNPDCWAVYRDLMGRHGVVSGEIAMELTETIIMDDPAKAADLLGHFRAAGMRLLLDDFGTGHSSLSYLHRFPFDVLKIDRSFISGIDRMASHEKLTRSIVGLARDLGMTTVAEGIESEAELRRVREIGCQYGQGYLFSKPLPAAEAKTLLGGVLPRGKKDLPRRRGERRVLASASLREKQFD